MSLPTSNSKLMHLFEIPSKALRSLLELMIPNRPGIERPECHGEVPVWSPDWPIFSSPTGTAPILLAKEPIKCPNAFLSSIPLDKGWKESMGWRSTEERDRSPRRESDCRACTNGYRLLGKPTKRESIWYVT